MVNSQGKKAKQGKKLQREEMPRKQGTRAGQRGSKSRKSQEKNPRVHKDDDDHSDLNLVGSGCMFLVLY